MGFLQFIITYVLRNQRTLLYTSLVLNFIVFAFILCLSLFRNRCCKTTEHFSAVNDSFSSNPKNYLRIPFLNFQSKNIDEYNGYVIIGDFFFRFGAEERVRQRLRLNGERMTSGGSDQITQEMLDLFNSFELNTISLAYESGNDVKKGLLDLYDDAKKNQGRGWGYYGIHRVVNYYTGDLERKLDRLIELIESNDETQTVIEKEFARNWLGGLAYHSVLENGTDRNEQIWIDENGKVHCSTTSSCLWIIWGKITPNEISALNQNDNEEEKKHNELGWADTYTVKSP